MRSKNIQSDGSGNGPDSDFINRVLERLKELQFYSTATVTVEQTTRGTRFHAKPSRGASGGSGSTGLNYRGLFSSGTTYNENDLVLVQTGVAAGGYISTIDSNNNDPATGIGWVQWPQTQSVGSWT
jgi:hypothetical protein